MKYRDVEQLKYPGMYKLRNQYNQLVYTVVSKLQPVDQIQPCTVSYAPQAERFLHFKWLKAK